MFRIDEKTNKIVKESSFQEEMLPEKDPAKAKVEDEVGTDGTPCKLVDDRYLIYLDNGCVYDTEEADEIPQYVFEIRDQYYKESLEEASESDWNALLAKADKALDELAAASNNGNCDDADGYWTSENTWCFRKLYYKTLSDLEQLQKLCDEYSKKFSNVKFYFINDTDISEIGYTAVKETDEIIKETVTEASASDYSSIDEYVDKFLATVEFEYSLEQIMTLVTSLFKFLSDDQKRAFFRIYNPEGYFTVPDENDDDFKDTANESFEDFIINDEEEDSIDRMYHDASEDELIKMGAFDNLNDEDDSYQIDKSTEETDDNDNINKRVVKPVEKKD